MLKYQNYKIYTMSKWENYKILMKQIKELSKWRYLYCQGCQSFPTLSTDSMQTQSKSQHVIHRTWQTDYKVHIRGKRFRIASILKEKKKPGDWHQISRLTINLKLPRQSGIGKRVSKEINGTKQRAWE
jgi:hypothetical protein